MFKKIAIAVAVIIAAVLIYAGTRPDTFRVERTASIKAPPERLFAMINDLQNWRAWSPYEKKDPAMKRTLSAPTGGKGAKYAWDGNKDVGQGQMEIVESTPPSKVTIKLDFLKPFEAHNTAEFTLEPQGEATAVTWSIYGPQPYVSKLMSIFLDFDTMIGQELY